MTGHVLPPLPLPQADLPQPGPRAVRHPRDEPLHPVLPLRRASTTTTPAAATSASSACATSVYFGRDRDGTLESEFSGNLVEVCPTGVFTDKTLLPALHAQVGPADGALGVPALRPGLQHHRRASATASCAACAAATTARSTATSSATAAASATSSSTRRSACAGRSLRRADGRACRAGRRATAARDGRRAGTPRPRLLRGRGDRHRLAARLARGQLRAARAGGRRALLPRHVRRRTTRLVGAAARRSLRDGACARRPRCATCERRRRRARPRRGRDQHGADARPGAPHVAAPAADRRARSATTSRAGTTPAIGAHQAARAERRCSIAGTRTRRKLDELAPRGVPGARPTTSRGSASRWRTSSRPGGAAPRVRGPRARAALRGRDRRARCAAPSGR